MNLKNKALAVLALPLLVLTAACGSDGGNGPTPTSFASPTPAVQGTWNGSWLVQFVRTRDGYTGSWTCPGTLTLNQTATSNTASAITGFAVVGGQCPPLSFDVRGTVQESGAIAFTTGGPKPGAGTCPQPSTTMSYSGLIQGRQISSRATGISQCPGELEGEYRFEYILTVLKNF